MIVFKFSQTCNTFFSIILRIPNMFSFFSLALMVFELWTIMWFFTKWYLHYLGPMLPPCDRIWHLIYPSVKMKWTREAQNRESLLKGKDQVHFTSLYWVVHISCFRYWNYILFFTSQPILMRKSQPYWSGLSLQLVFSAHNFPIILLNG